MKVNSRIVISLSILCVFFACSKELSTENGGFGGTAQGTLTDSAGNCGTITVNGSYFVDTTLADSNYVLVNVNFTTQGKYLMSSDTVNGIWFLDSGFALSTGAKTIKVRGKGKPLLAKSSNFTLGFNGSFCGFIVTASGSSTSGGSGGGNTGGTGGGDYFPTTAGSSWSYKYDPALNSISTFSVTVAPKQVTLDSLNYSQFATSLLDTFYFAKNTTIGNYYALSTIDFDYTFLFDSIPSFYITYPFLKESANVNDTWETPEYGTVKLVTGNTVERGKAKAVFTIISKNTVPHTVGGTAYTNVINVQREIKFLPANGSYRTLLTGNSFYAKGYGLIDQVIGSEKISLTTTPTIK